MHTQPTSKPKYRAAAVRHRHLLSLHFLWIALMCGPSFANLGTRATPDSVIEAREADSALSGDVGENEFQDDVDTMLETQEPAVDTSGWDHWKINNGHFASDSWTDTARIALVDSEAGCFYHHPFKNVITSNFGQRRWVWHKGVDIRLAKGDTVRAAFDGIVRVTKKDRRGYGNVVVIRHPHGIETIYGHLSKECVRNNDQVKAGDVIGLGGSTGHSTGCHLHFEMRYCGEPFDPNCIIDFENYSLKSDTLVLTRSSFAYLVDLRKAKWHIVHRGETLGHIAVKYHTSVRNLCALNHVGPRATLSVGRKLLVVAAKPSVEKGARVASRADPE